MKPCRDFVEEYEISSDQFRVVAFEEAFEKYGSEAFEIRDSDGNPLEGSHWPNGTIDMPGLLNEIDHVISVGRISTHAIAGTTLLIKNLMGLVGMQSRMELHAGGPMNWFVSLMSAGTCFAHMHSPSNDFPEMVTEIGLALHDKLLGGLLVADEIQTTMGPNAHLLDLAIMASRLLESIGLKEESHRRLFGFFNNRSWPLFESHVHKPETGLVIASKDIVAADAVAAGFLAMGYEETPWFRRALNWVVEHLVNAEIQGLGDYDVYGNPFIDHGLKTGLGKYPELECHDVPDKLRENLEAAVKAPETEWAVD
jgi:hypothetical protein